MVRYKPSVGAYHVGLTNMRLVWWVLGLKSHEPVLVAEECPNPDCDEGKFHYKAVSDLAQATTLAYDLARELGLEAHHDEDSTRDLEYD